jgi:hypothetical protein
MKLKYRLGMLALIGVTAGFWARDGSLGGSIYGLVRDSVTKKPLAHVKLTVDVGYAKMKTKTLPNGYYSIVVPAGTNYTIKAEKKGYVTA